MRKIIAIIVLAFVLIASILFYQYSSRSDDASTLVVYSGRSEALIGPLLKQFERDSGISLDVRYNSTAPLATQILQEGDNTPADVVFFQESGYLDLLAEETLLLPLDPSLLEQVDVRYRDDEGYWIGTSARLRVLAYNTDLLTPEQLPETLQDLADEQWRDKIGWALSNASTQAHLSALRELWGEEALTEWLLAIKANQPKRYASNAQILNAVANQEIAIGWLNHYYLYRLKQQRPDLAVANYDFPAQGQAGNLMISAGAGILASTEKADLAQQFIAYLIAAPGQTYFTEEDFEYPTQSGFPVNTALPSLDDISLTEVPQSVLVDVVPTIQLLESLKLF
ncbi:MAG: extracellular solute-binding protein, partial [Gammaproteobacteria bacterium]